MFAGQVEGRGGGQREDVLRGEDQLHRGTERHPETDFKQVFIKACECDSTAQR